MTPGIRGGRAVARASRAVTHSDRHPHPRGQVTSVADTARWSPPSGYSEGVRFIFRPPAERHYDVSFAAERVGGELFDLQAGGLPRTTWTRSRWPPACRAATTRCGPNSPARSCSSRRAALPVAQRINRLNELGFDVDELELITTEAGTRLRVHTQVAESGRHRDQLFTRTGLRATENQARRMLNDVISFRGYLEQKEGRRSRRRWPRTAGAPRSSTRCWPWCRGSCRTGWPPPRCSTRSSSTAGSCPSRLVPTSAPRPRRGPM
jgi:hypothetical protein